MARAAFPIADRVSLADVGEYMKRKNDLHEGLARDDVQDALVDGCGVELRWVKEGREVCREYPEPDFWRRPILVWHGVLPRRLHVQLPPEEQKGDRLVYVSAAYRCRAIWTMASVGIPASRGGRTVVIT